MRSVFARLFNRRAQLVKESESTSIGRRVATQPTPVVTEPNDGWVIFGSQGRADCFRTSPFDSTTGVLSNPRDGLPSKNPVYFVLSPKGRFLYSCNPGHVIEGRASDSVSAYLIDSQDGTLMFLNRVPAGGLVPTYLSFDKDSRHLLVANYESGTVSVMPIGPDGHLGARTAQLSFIGSSIDPVRQRQAYAHCVLVDPSGRFLLVADLGSDKIWIAPFDLNTGALGRGEPSVVSVQAGDGPRHLAFHPNHRWLYANGEIGNSVSQFEWDGDAGTLLHRSRVATLPASFRGKNTSAEMRIGPSGKFLYVSNRGHDSIAVFAVDERSGRLHLVQHAPSCGRTPRTFDIDPTGRWMIIANTDSHNAAVLSIDPDSGRLAAVGEPVSISSPACPRFVARV